MALGFEEKKSITNFSANIYSHKQMRFESYGLLANKSLDETILALVAGVYGAVTVSQLILVTGISGAIIMLRPIPTSDK